jgi:signal transduction histidine kinase/AmiR/NasT family two-component response regulator
MRSVLGGDESMAESPTMKNAAPGLATALGGYALLGGLLSFLGWPLDVLSLTDWFNDGVSIQPNACLLIMLAGTGLLLVRWQAWRAVTALGGLVGLGGALILLQYIVGVDFGFNHQLLFGRAWGQGTTLTPGRVGPPASTSFALTGIALVLLGRAGLQERCVALRRLVPLAGMAICVTMTFSLFGYMFGAEQFYTIPWLTAIALQTSTMLLAMGLGLIVSVPEHQPMLLLREQSGAAALARFAIPALMIVIPLVLWLRVWGYERGHYDLGSGRALGALTLVVCTVGILWIALMAVRRREQALRESEARLRSIIEQLPAGVGVMDRTGTWTLTNSQMDSYVPKAIPSTRPDRIARWQAWDEQGNPVGPENWPGHRALRGETVLPGLEMLYTHDDGRELWMRVSTAPLRNGIGEIIGATCVLQDVTNIKEAQEAVRERAEELEKLMDLMPVAVWIARDAACQQISGNRAGHELLRVPSGHNLSKTAAAGEQPPGFRIMRDGQEIAPEELPMQFATARGVEVRRCEEEIVFDDGTVVHAYGSATPLFDEDGQVRGCIGAFMDVTELRRLERELQQTNEELAAADRRKDEFLATLAHELRNPLAPVMNSLAILDRFAVDEAIAIDARATMWRQMKQMVRLIDDLLDVSRISRGTIELRKERVELQSVIYQTIESAGPVCEAARQTLAVDLPPQPVWIDADPVRLAQIIGNLLSNASRYSDTGSEISVRAECAGNELVVRVKDRGIGIPLDKLESVFEMFSQLDRSLERTAGGLGIGLYIVKRLVAMHDGSVTASSEGLGTGSEFTVRLPIVLEPSDAVECAAPMPDQAAAPSMHQLRVLIVDDNHDAARTMATLLRAYGYVTQAAHDGLQAVEAAERFKPHVILLDIGLPKLNGYEACRQIRAQSWGSDMVVIALTGWGQEEDKRRADESGFDAHIVKPVATTWLIELLISKLQERDRTDALVALDARSSG